MKKGFTLIELLAVIVILAVIAVIATPIVLNIINDAKESAALRSAQFYMDGVEQSLLLSRLNSGKVKDGTYSIIEEGNVCIGEFTDNKCKDILKVEVKGDAPTTGTITIKDGEIKKVDIILSDKEIWTDPFTGKIEYKLAPGLYDENDKLLASWEELNEIALNEYGEDFKNLIENGGYDDFEWFGYAGRVVDSVKGASKLILDDSVTKIGDDVFLDSFNLKSIIISNSVTSIAGNVFEDSNLTSIVISESVTSIEKYTFFHAFSLTTIIVDPDNPVYDSRDNSNAIIETATNELVIGCKNTVIPESVTSIENNAFEEMELSEITIPESVRSIGDFAFSYSFLKKLTISNGVTSIGDCAFEQASLTKVIIPESVRSIGIYAFGSSNLTEVTILSTEANIADDAFDGCTNLKTIYYKGNIEGATWIPEGVTVVSDF